MFGRTFSFWRRLVGRDVPASDEANADRRLWVRYPADLHTNVQLAGGAVLENRISAEVRDISLGGVNLVVGQSFNTGQLLSVELPHIGDADRHTVLACVVRVVLEGPGAAVPGCVFSRELTEEGPVEGFGAKRVRHAPSDQRTWMRFATRLTATYQKIGAADTENHSAQVINVSASGVGLLVTAEVEAGALLSVDLTSTDGKFVRTILACVVHVSTQSNGSWALGCNFIRELSEEDLKALI